MNPTLPRSGRGTCAKGISRRAVLQAGALGVAGFTLADWFAARAVAEQTSVAQPVARATRCILLFMWGGPSQLETWDLKPDATDTVRGEFQPISTSVPGIQISEHFPMLAEQAHRYAIVRSVTHNDGAHLSSVHHLMTGRLAPKPMSDADPPSRADWPCIGSMLARLREEQTTLPQHVLLPWRALHPSAPGGVAPGQDAGMLGPAYDPFVVLGDPNADNFQVSGLAVPDGLSAEQLQSRKLLLEMIDHQRSRLDEAAVSGFDRHKQRAVDLVTSASARQAFDLTQETPEMRERYGRNVHGQCVLMARRLIEAGVPLVTVNWHNDGHYFWDTHGSNFVRHKNDLMPPADRAFSALLDDLADRGLLDETIVLWVGEFGRNPTINKAANAGRDHWPWCYSAVFAGGGIRGGQVFGRSDNLAGRPASDPVSPADLTATLYHALGFGAETFVADRLGRPVRLTQGNPIQSLFG